MSNPTFEEGALARRKKPGEALTGKDTLLPASPYGIHQTTPPTLADGDVSQQQLDDLGNTLVAFGDPAQLAAISGATAQDVLFAYDVGGNLEYIGKAPAGSGQDDAVWAIYKLTWGGSNPTAKNYVYGAWDGRVALFP